MQLMSIHAYPMLKPPIMPAGRGTSAPEMGSTTATPADMRVRVVEMSDQAAMTEEPTMRKKDASVRPVTDPPNQMTSP